MDRECEEITRINDGEFKDHDGRGGRNPRAKEMTEIATTSSGHRFRTKMCCRKYGKARTPMDTIHRADKSYMHWGRGHTTIDSAEGI